MAFVFVDPFNTPPPPPRRSVTPPSSAWLDRLARIWEDPAVEELERGLAVGHELNTCLGRPPDRLPDGGPAFLKAVAGRLGLSQPDLQRMRWFPVNFKDLADLRKSYPGVKSWADFKAEVTGEGFRPSGKGRNSASSKAGAEVRLGELVEHVAAAIRLLQELAPIPPTPLGDEARKAVALFMIVGSQSFPAPTKGDGASLLL